MAKIRATVWNEFRHEKNEAHIKAVYPDGLHDVIASCLAEDGDIEAKKAALDDPDQGLPDSLLDQTDVLLWWGHMAHHEVSDALVEKVCRRVIGGMGLIVLHSGHHSKVFRSIIGDSGNLMWGDMQKEIVWNVNPTHPIAAGIPSHFVLEAEELYAEPFCIPQPDEQIFLSWFEKGYLFRSGNLWRRGRGKVFYFQPGHEEYPIYFDPNVRRILRNAVRYCAPAETGYRPTPYGVCPCVGGFAADGEEIADLKKE